MPTKTPRLILRTVGADMTSHGGFVWPTEGKVTAPDWNPEPECGGGLHGLLNGQGDAGLLDWSDDARWIVAKPGKLLVHLGGKVKCKTATVVYCGDRAGALATLRDAGVTDPLPGDVVSGGGWSTVSGGDWSTASGGDRSIVSGGYGSTVSGGDRSTVSGSDRSTVSGAHWSTVSGGYGSTVSGGNRSTVSGGDWSIVSGGDRSIVSGGDRSIVSGGYRSTVSGGYGSTVSGGYGSTLCVKYHDGWRYRIAVAYPGEDGIKPDTPYRVNNVGGFVEVDQ